MIITIITESNFSMMEQINDDDNTQLKSLLIFETMILYK